LASVKKEKNMSDRAILEDLGQSLAELRIARGFTQAAVAKQAGIGKRTVERIEAGISCQTSSLLRVLRVLGLEQQIPKIVPIAGPSPVAVLETQRKQRKRARSKSGTRAAASSISKQKINTGGEWTWGDEK
jgi:DNA-binding XRE family transcriptional regulator